MGDKSAIEWTEATWNPIRGCTRVSEGCRNCYAERVAMRFSGKGQPYEGLVQITNGHPQWTGEVNLVEEHLMDPLHWKKPRKIFVNSMSDLFHPGVPFYAIDQIYVDWVVVGGESGPGARPMHPDWARSLRDQCQAAGVPFFFKQWGEWCPDDQLTNKEIETRRGVVKKQDIQWRIGKKAAGRLLDGEEWNQYPEVKQNA